MNNAKIDVHTHYLPAGYVAALKQHIAGNPDGWPTPEWQVDDTLGFMKQNGIGYSVLSLSSPHINFNDKAETLRLAEEANQLGGDLTTKYPDQLGYFATLPFPYEAESVDAIKKAFDQYHALGVTVPTNSRGVYFGSPSLDKVYQELNDRHAIVTMHPNEPSSLPQNVNFDLPIPLMGFFMDTTMTFMNLLKYRFFERFPDIKLIVPHAGAFMGILTDRVAEYVKSAYDADIYAVMKHVYFDTAGAVLPRQLPTLLTLADENHILYGSDIPYTALESSAKLQQKIADTDALTDLQKQKIFHDNATQLLEISR
ncbi:amidohydrolase family protein [Lentilactobacillus farraginis]|uniref:6-methylsalicylate decarboxylase n=1 Tax=Lentilactobacillus farraginis DSM 18382 = JCM 14108 TaxID=1423743 RepID=X0PJ41_9LACO|nr:amidohydrolase family protein [Lentilactobacillus farraginis]GAF37217.1 metal-dependent hydrolase [Lentilactobacillus farraginis DSM 18382 = JCM 14108]